jgi:hypothetical protein
MGHLDLYPFKGSNTLTRSVTAAHTSRTIKMLKPNQTMRSMTPFPVAQRAYRDRTLGPLSTLGATKGS